MELSQPVDDYRPRYNELLVKQLLSHYKQAPETFNLELVEQIKQDAQYYGLDTHIDTDITLGGVLKQAGAGFISGFTTFNVGDEPENAGERIARNVGNLAGFVGYLPALPAKAGVIAKAANALKGKSVPMFVSGKVTEAVRGIASDVTRDAIKGRAGAFKTMSEFLQQGPVKNTLEGAFHLGVASSVSSWQGGVDEMMHAFIGGAQTGAAFRLIGNYLRVPGADIPKFGAKWKDLNEAQQSETALKMIASSLYTGLPATLRGETAPEQIYEYLLGAYFGRQETPGEQRVRDKQIVSLFRQPTKDNPFKLAELTPGWKKLSSREQKLVQKERDRIFADASGISAGALDYMKQSYHLPELKEESGKKPEMPNAATDIQFNVRDNILTGKEISKETWSKMTKEDKEFYATSVDASNLTGMHNWYEIQKWSRKELETVAGFYKINPRKLTDRDLGLEIMFAQRKKADGTNEILQDTNNENNVVIDQKEVGESIIASNPSPRSEQFSQNFLSKGLESLPPAERNAQLASYARLIEIKVGEIMRQASKDGKTPDSREFMEWANEKFGFEKFDEPAHNMVRQWFKLADPVNVKQVPFVSARIVGHELKEGYQSGDVFVDRLATNGTPIDMMGNKKLMRFPKNRLDLVAEEMGLKGDVYSIFDNVIIQGTSGMSQKSLYRYKEWLESQIGNKLDKSKQGQIDYKGDIKGIAYEQYYKMLGNVMHDMYKNESKHYFGGSGDKERGYFVREHRDVQENGVKLKTQINEILRTLTNRDGDSKILDLSRAEFIKQFETSNVSKEELSIMHDRAFVSNFLWDMQINGFNMPVWGPGSNAIQRRNQMSYAVADGMISTPREFNKRAQIWNTNGFKIEDKYVEDALVGYKDNVLALSPETATSRGGYRVLVIKDDAYKNLIEATDGAILTHDKILEIESREAGMPEAARQGQSKSFIVSPHAQHGTMLGKYMKHAAGKTISKAMEEYVDPITGETGVHMLIYESAAKQLGGRAKEMGVASYNEATGKLEVVNDKGSAARVFRIKPSDQHVVLSELQNADYIHPHKLPSQALSSLTPSSLMSKVKQETVDDMMSTLMNESYYSKPAIKTQLEAWKQTPKDRVMIEDFFRKFEEVGINDVIDILNNNRFNHIHDRIYQKIAKITKKREEESSLEGESSPEQIAEFYEYVEQFQSPAERLTNIGAKIGGEHNVPVLSTLLGKEVKPWMETVLSKYIVEKATRPELKNSVTARMRPYDFRLRQKIKDLKENEFYLDEYFRDTPIKSSLKERTLGEIWDNYSATSQGAARYSKEQMAVADGIFRTLNLRVPMDSISGGRVLDFKGFTGRKGHGVLLHPAAMKALGGADLDGDKAHIFFGGRDAKGEGEGMKQSWLDMYKANEGEFTRYRNKVTGEISGDNTGGLVRKIISGGQVGVDMRGLEIAKELGLETGGTAPPGWVSGNKNQRALLESFGLKEGAPDPSKYRLRTLANVRNSDGTILWGNMSSPGSRLTIRYAQENNKPHLLANNKSPKEISEWLIANNIQTLNAAGNRKPPPGFGQRLKEALTYGKGGIKRDPKVWEKYTFDNKNEPILFGPDKGKTPRELFTAEVNDLRVRRAINDRAIRENPNDNGVMYYSPWARQRMSEGAAMGRFILGNVVVMKKALTGAHHALIKAGGKERVSFEADTDGNRISYDIVARTDPRALELFRQLSRTGIALGSDPMNEIGLKGMTVFRDKMWESLFKVENIEVPDLAVGSAKAKKFFFEGDGKHKVIYNGMFKRFSDANNALYGKNYKEERQHTLYERQTNSEGLAKLPIEQRNSVLPKIASLINPLKIEDTVLKRINPKKLEELYNWFSEQSRSNDLNQMKAMLQRYGFTVKPKEDYVNTVFSNRLWERSQREKVLNEEGAFKALFGIKEVDGKNDYSEAISHTKQEFYPLNGYKKLSFEETINPSREYAGGRTSGQWREYHLEQLVKKAEHFIENDIRDMVSVKELYDVIYKNKIPFEDVERVTQLGSIVRGLDRQMQQQRKLPTGETDKATGVILKRTAEKNLDIEAQKTGLTHQSDIERYVLQAKETMTPAEKELFDTFVVGSLHRSDRKVAEQIKQEILDAGEKMPEILAKELDKVEEPTTKTSTSTFGLRNSRVSDQVLERYIKDSNDLFNFVMEMPTTRELKQLEINAVEKAKEPQKVKGTDGKQLEVDVYENPYIHLEGLREARKKPLDKEGREILAETEGHLEYYHNSVGKNLPEIVASLTGKEINAMTYEDWRNVNRYFKDLRTQSLWDKMFSSIELGKPEIFKRYWHLFPETVNRKLMLHDFVLMDKAAIVMRKDGIFRNKIVKMPTHQLGKEVHISGHIQHSLSSANESEQNDFHKKLNPLIENNKEGKDIYELAAREMEYNFGKELVRKSLETGDKAKQAQAQPYFENYNVKKASVNYEELMSKVYKVPVTTKDGAVKMTEMTGEQYKNHFIDVIAERNKLNYEFQVGNPKYREMFALRDSKGNKKYFSHKDPKKEDFLMYDIDKVHAFLMEHVARGKNIPKDMGIWLMNGVTRQYQYNNAPSRKQREMIAKERIKEPEKINFRQYIPHVIMDVQRSQKEMMNSLKSIVEKESDSPQRSAKIQKILWNHHLRTGDWLTPEIKQWDLFDTVKREIDLLGDKVSKSAEQSYLNNSKPGFMEQRSIHMDGWTIEPRAYDVYMRQMFGSYYRNMGQFLGRHDLDKFVKEYEKKWGPELTEAWRKYISIYINNAAGYPANLPAEYLDDPHLNVKGTPYAWWADNNVVNKTNRALERMGLSDKDVPAELRGMTHEKLRNWSNLEAKWQLAALLAHPKTAIGNLYGGSALTIANTGWRNFRRARDINFLKSKLNPGKDEFGNEWNSLQDINQYIYNLGVMPEMITYEMNLNPATKRANAQKFVKAAVSKIEKDPAVKDATLRGMMKEYGVSDSFWNKAAYFMRTSERALRRDSFMAHLIQAWENYGGALPANHPVLIEQAKRGVKATQFLYNAPYRPMFAQTQLGKVLTRFQLWSWNSVRFRNDVMRDAKIHGFREGTAEYDRFVRTAQLDLFMLAMSSVFMYSLFESALPAPWNWFQDTADWLLGDEKERDRAFFGAYPSSVAPLQMITPPAARMLPATFKGIVEDDWSKMSDYVIWTMFPFGRLARDIAGPNSIIENPTRSVEKLTGLPYIQFGQEMKKNRDEKTLHPKGLVNF